MRTLPLANTVLVPYMTDGIPHAFPSGVDVVFVTTGGQVTLYGHIQSFAFLAHL